MKSILKRLLPKHSFVRRVGVLAGGTAAAQAITICAMPFVTRIYSPEQIGIISIFLAFFSYWASALSLRYEYALLIAQDDVESHEIQRLAIIFVFVMSFLGFPILWGLRYANLLEFGLLPNWTPFVAVPLFLGYGCFAVFRLWALRAGLIRQITQATIGRSGANALTRIGLGLAGGGLLGLFLAELAGAYASMIRLAIATRRHFSKSKPACFSRERLIEVARKYYKFPLLEVPSTWLDVLAMALPLPMVATLYGAAAAGWFGLARMVVSLPNSQIGAAVADVFQMELAKAVLERDLERTRLLFYSLMRKMAVLGLVPLAGSVFLLPRLAPVIFGHQWLEAGYAAAAMAPWVYAALIVSPLSRALSVLQRQEFKLIYDGFVIILIVISFFFAKLYNFKFIEFIITITVANIIGYIVYAIILRKVVDLKIRS